MNTWIETRLLFYNKRKILLLNDILEDYVKNFMYYRFKKEEMYVHLKDTKKLNTELLIKLLPE